MALLIQVWKIFATLFAIILFMFITSAIICGSNEECRYHIPTVSNMLNSTMTTPFLISGFNTAIGFHMLTVVSLYCMTVGTAYYWSILQASTAVLVYASLVITLFIIPFTGWEYNWANLGALVGLVLWMGTAQVSIIRGFHTSFRQTLIPFVLFVSCVIVYIAVRSAVHGVNERDVGLVVTESIGCVSFVVFMLMCIWQVRHLGIRILVPSSPSGKAQFIIGGEDEE